MDSFIIASACIIVFGFGIFIGINIQRNEVFEKARLKMDEKTNYNQQDKANVRIDKNYNNSEFNYKEYLTDDGKFFTTKHIRGDDK